MIRTLDTREQKSPQFLLDAFPAIKITQMVSGDYFSGEWVKKQGYWTNEKWDRLEKGIRQIDGKPHYLEGNLVEIKIGKDFGIHTEPLERFQDELSRMRDWQKSNPHVDLHAVWMTGRGDYGITKQEWMLFMHMCFAYNIWGHICLDEDELIDFLRDLDQPKSYQRDIPFMKRTKAPTDEARVFRVPIGVSSELAMKLDKCQSFDEVVAIFGRTKKSGRIKHPYGKWKELMDSLYDYYHKIFLETGDAA